MEKYEFNVVGSELYSFIWDDFCDWYIELAKINMNDTTKSVLLHTLTAIIKMLHPFMPYVTEEIYGMLPIKDAKSIMISAYPYYDENLVFPETGLDDIIELITKIRKAKLENKIGNDFVIATYGNEIIENSKDILARMTKCQNFVNTYEGEFTNLDIAFMDSKISLFYDGSMSEEDRKLLEKEIEKLKASIERREKLLSNENYTSKAPAHVVENDRKTLEKEKNELELLINKLKN